MRLTVHGVAGGCRYSVDVTPDPTPDDRPGAAPEPDGAPAAEELEHENEELLHEKDDLEHQNEELRRELAGKDRPRRRAAPSVRGCSWYWPVCWPCSRSSSSTPATRCSTRTRSCRRSPRWPRIVPYRRRWPPGSATASCPRSIWSSGSRTPCRARADFLATPITSTVKSATYTIVLKLAQSSQFQTLWEQALRRSHEQVDNLLTGQKVGALAATNGEVTVDLFAGRVQGQAGAGVPRSLGLRQGTAVHRGALRPLPVRAAGQAAAVGQVPRPPRPRAPRPGADPLRRLGGPGQGPRTRPRARRGGLAVSMALLLVAANVGRNQYLSVVATRADANPPPPR